ncbi:MAG: bifunctional phosphoribosylaminoimidazolecarboxamide formyltransferase/IMP cyclohydrolase [Planctomycetes bacterium]|nr:bifunctional phosphoribosylaminoimidazolecarboxamide formyltransferase/IMP cyclohydrolase [Planctomycetota bacterium]
MRPVPVRALLSVSDKTGLAEFGRGLAALGWEILSTGGTAKALRDAGLKVVEVGDLTGFGEVLGGRVKTLHPAVHAGILARRDVPGDLALLAGRKIGAIDLVCVNLYPFEETVAKGAAHEEVVEQIDIGGPSMLRSAAKNHCHVLVVADPARYTDVLSRLREGTSGEISFRESLALDAFARSARYEAAILAYFQRRSGEPLPETLALGARRARVLRYGENPHQRGALYARGGGGGIAGAALLSGKDPSYTNYLDLEAAWRAALAFSRPTVAVIKHTNPCGLAEAATLPEALDGAWAGDPVSAFGSVVGCNRPVDVPFIRALLSQERFLEGIVAPSVDSAVIDLLRAGPKWGRSVRVLAVPGTPDAWDVRSLSGGFLVQERDVPRVPREAWRCVTKATPSEAAWRDLAFAWTACRFVTSNAICLASDSRLVGVGSGQMSRVDAVEIAVRKAGARAEGSALASDAFFPFPDGIERAAKAGIAAVIQPGGSIRDKAVFAAADAAGVAMVVTGERHFRH